MEAKEAKVNLPTYCFNRDADYIQISWHTPTPEEIDLALRILREITESALQTSESLVEATSTTLSSRDWGCEFTRHCTALKYAWLSIAGLATVDVAGDPGLDASDSG